jgi:hypothetical protein
MESKGRRHSSSALETQIAPQQSKLLVTTRPDGSYLYVVHYALTHGRRHQVQQLGLGLDQSICDRCQLLGVCAQVGSCVPQVMQPKAAWYMHVMCSSWGETSVVALDLMPGRHTRTMACRDYDESNSLERDSVVVGSFPCSQSQVDFQAVQTV